MTITLTDDGIAQFRAAVDIVALLLGGKHIAKCMKIALLPHAPVVWFGQLIGLQLDCSIKVLTGDKCRHGMRNGSQWQVETYHFEISVC